MHNIRLMPNIDIFVSVLPYKIVCNYDLNRSGSSMTGKLLAQGLRAPNYVFEPLSVYENDMQKLITKIGLKKASQSFAKKFREELTDVFLTGQQNNDSLHTHMALRECAHYKTLPMIVENLIK